MLFGNMKESEPNAEIEIADIDANAFKAMTKFAYCNDPQLTADNIISVRVIADKYQISALSEMCDSTFNSFVTTQNICSLLTQSTNCKLKIYAKKTQNLLSEKESNFKTKSIIKS